MVYVRYTTCICPTGQYATVSKRDLDLREMTAEFPPPPKPAADSVCVTRCADERGGLAISDRRKKRCIPTLGGGQNHGNAFVSRCGGEMACNVMAR